MPEGELLGRATCWTVNSVADVSREVKFWKWNENWPQFLKNTNFAIYIFHTSFNITGLSVQIITKELDLPDYHI